MNFIPRIPISVKNLCKDILTGIDGQSFDIARVTWFIGSVFYMGMTLYEVIVHKTPFNYENWSIGFGTIMAAGGVAVKVKESTEPQESTASISSNQ